MACVTYRLRKRRTRHFRYRTERDRHRNDGDGFYQRFRFHGSSGISTSHFRNFYLPLPEPFSSWVPLTSGHPLNFSSENWITSLVFWWFLLALSQGPTLMTSRYFDDFWSGTSCKLRISSVSLFMNLGSQSYRQRFTAWTTETYRPIHTFIIRRK